MGLNPDDLTEDPAPGGQPQQQPRPIADLDPEALRHELQMVRGEAAKYRKSNRTFRTMLAELTGHEVPDGQVPPDLDTLKRGMDSRIGEVRSLKIARGLDNAAHRHGVSDPDLLGAYLERGGRLKNLDPDAEDFADRIDELVAETVTEKPVLRGDPGATRTGGAAPTAGARFSGGEQHRAQLTRSSLASMTPEEVTDAMHRGLLDRLLGR
jgi:hypothetical protein